MRIPARAAGPLVAMAIAIASFGCIAPAAYAENATAAVISDDGGHVVVDVDLNGSAPVGDATEQADMKSSQGESVSNAEPDEALKAFEALMTANGIQARAKAEAEATRLKGESEGAAEKAHGEDVAAGIKAQAEAYNGMDNPYLLANRYIDIMPKVAEQVAKPLTAVDSIKMYGSGNAQKLVKETTSIVDQVASGLKDSTGIDLPSLLNGLISNPDIDVDSAENSVE